MVALQKGTTIFTFADGMVEKISTNIESDVDIIKMPGGGPGSNYGNDYNGVTKIITIEGNLFNTESSVLNDANLRDMKLMKYWLEALQDGGQTPLIFIHDLDEYSVVSSGTTDMVDSISGDTISLPAKFVQTKVYVKSFVCDDTAPRSTIPFTLQLEVVGN